MFLVVAALILAGCASTTPEQGTINAAASAIGGADKIRAVNTLVIEGTGENGNLGQNNNANHPWPMANANDYVRAIDFTQPASRATWVTYGAPVTGGAAAQQSLAGGLPVPHSSFGSSVAAPR